MSGDLALRLHSARPAAGRAEERRAGRNVKALRLATRARGGARNAKNQSHDRIYNVMTILQ
jgi:hypothetical protein